MNEIYKNIPSREKFTPQFDRSRNTSRFEGESPSEQERALKDIRKQRDALEAKALRLYTSRSATKDDVQNLDYEMASLRRQHQKTQDSSRDDRDQFFQKLESTLAMFDKNFENLPDTRAVQSPPVPSPDSQSRSRLVRGTPSSTPGAYGRAVPVAPRYERQAMRRVDDSSPESADTIETQAQLRFANKLGVSLEDYQLALTRAENSQTQTEILKNPDIFGADNDQNTQDARELAKTLLAYFLEERTSSNEKPPTPRTRLVRNTSNSVPGAYGQPVRGSAQYSRETLRPIMKTRDISSDKAQEEIERQAQTRFAKALGIAKVDNFAKILTYATDAEKEILRNPDILGDASNSATREARMRAQEILENVLTAKKHRAAADALQISFDNFEKAYRAANNREREILLSSEMLALDPSSPPYSQVFEKAALTKAKETYQQIISSLELSRDESGKETINTLRFVRALGVDELKYTEAYKIASPDQQRALRNLDILKNDGSLLEKSAKDAAFIALQELTFAANKMRMAKKLGISLDEFNGLYTLATRSERNTLLNADALAYDPSSPQPGYDENAYAFARSQALLTELQNRTREGQRQESRVPQIERVPPQDVTIRGARVPGLPRRSAQRVSPAERLRASSLDKEISESAELSSTPEAIPEISNTETQAIRERYGIGDVKDFLAKYTNLSVNTDRAENLLPSDIHDFFKHHTAQDVVNIMVRNSAPATGFFARIKQAATALTTEERMLQKLVLEFNDLTLETVPSPEGKEARTQKSTPSRVRGRGPARPEPTGFARGVAKQ